MFAEPALLLGMLLYAARPPTTVLCDNDGSAKKKEVVRKRGKNPFDFFLAFTFVLMFFAVAFLVGCRVRGL